MDCGTCYPCTAFRWFSRLGAQSKNSGHFMHQVFSILSLKTHVLGYIAPFVLNI